MMLCFLSDLLAFDVCILQLINKSIVVRHDAPEEDRLNDGARVSREMRGRNISE